MDEDKILDAVEPRDEVFVGSVVVAAGILAVQRLFQVRFRVGVHFFDGLDSGKPGDAEFLEESAVVSGVRIESRADERGVAVQDVDFPVHG